MKLAVTYENGQVFQHFGHCRQFKLYTVEDGRIIASDQGWAQLQALRPDEYPVYMN